MRLRRKTAPVAEFRPKTRACQYNVRAKSDPLSPPGSGSADVHVRVPHFSRLLREVGLWPQRQISRSAVPAPTRKPAVPKRSQPEIQQRSAILFSSAMVI